MNTALSVLPSAALADLTNVALIVFGMLIGAGIVAALYFRARDRWEQALLDAELKRQQDVAAAEQRKEHWRTEATRWAAEAQRLQASLDGARHYQPQLVVARPCFPRPLGLRDRRLG